jgi:hypothetical protein
MDLGLAEAIMMVVVAVWIGTGSTTTDVDTAWL